jgi:hypothetical protein
MVESFIDPCTRRKLVLLPADEAAAVAILEQDMGPEVRKGPVWERGGGEGGRGGGGEGRPRPRLEAAWQGLGHRHPCAGAR